MGTLLLKLAICLLACCYARSDYTDADQKELSTCCISYKCYNPLWCEAVFSARECSNRSRCCTDIYNKVECLTELLQNTSKTCKGSILSTEIVVNLAKNVSLAESQLETFKKDIDELKTLTNDNGKVAAETSTLKTDLSSVKTSLDSLNQKSLDACGKHKALETEIEQVKQHNAKTSKALEKLDDEIDSTSDKLSSMESVTEKQLNELQTQLSTITDTLDNNISNNENKLQGLLRKETDALSQRLRSSDDRWKEVVNNLNTSVEVLSGTLKNVKVKVTQDLKETSIEIKDNIKTIDTKTQNIEKGFETFKNIIGDDIEKKANSVSEQLLAKIKERSTTLDGKLTELQTLLNSRTSNLDTEIKQLTNSLTKSKQDLESKIKEDTETFRTEVNQSIDNLDRKLKNMLENTKTDIDDTNRRVSELRKDIEEYKRESAQNLETEKKSLTDFIHRKISEVRTETGNSIEKVLKDIEDMNESYLGQYVKVEDSFIMAFMILIVMVFVLAVSVYNLYQRSNNNILERTDGQTAAVRRKVVNNLGSHEILRHIPKSPDLEPGVCIISFDESRTETHKRILDTANIPNCSVRVHVVRRHEHILNLPRCKLYLMCTEFSERHVIIEEPGKGLGDLHRTTYDAVMKLGGFLIILYTRDPESRNLKDQCRYNPKIYCVANQPELSVLNQDGRFFSVYDNLTQYQKAELRKQICENMT